jgi:nucleoside-diphosphate-sugar epimerase
LKASENITDALIGYTGFVGSNLMRVRSEKLELFNSKNIQSIRGRHFRRVVCAGVSAVKWLANKEPDKDRKGIDTLVDCLRHVSADFFTLISTIDVYDQPLGVTEDTRPVPAPTEAYGKNRLVLEDFVLEHFERHLIVRLPALFGPGLKKNVIFDLMHDNGLESINPESRFQWYPVARLAEDLHKLESGGHPIINLATEPVATAQFHAIFFANKVIGKRASPPACYDMRTKYDSLMGGRSGYFMDRSHVVSALGEFLSHGY